MYENYYNNQMDTSAYLSRTYRWMFCGLLLTFLVGAAGCVTGAVYILFSSPILLGLVTIGELALVVYLSARINQMSASGATGLYLAYAVLNGVVFSAYFVLYDLSSMIFCFAAAGLYFGIMSVYGATTHKDLSSWGSILFCGLLAMVVCSIVMCFLGSFRITEIIICGIGLLIFMGLTAYDTQKILRYLYSCQGNSEMSEKVAIYGALNLYLDFINIFIYILRLVGRSRKNN